MKKILGLTVAALLVMGLVGGGTFAFFSDVETSSANVITAGTLDLTLNDTDDNVNIIAALTNKKPGDADKTPGPSAALKNAGSLTGGLSITFGAVTNTESVGVTEFEADGGAGELGAKVKIAPWIDVNANSTFDTGDLPLKSDGTVKAFADGLQWDTINAFGTGSVTFTNAIASFAGTTPGPAASVKFYLPWDFVEPGSEDNSAQGDSFSIGITFTLK